MFNITDFTGMLQAFFSGVCDDASGSEALLGAAGEDNDTGHHIPLSCSLAGAVNLILPAFLQSIMFRGAV